jgi:hypothetical protein
LVHVLQQHEPGDVERIFGGGVERCGGLGTANCAAAALLNELLAAAAAGGICRTRGLPLVKLAVLLLLLAAEVSSL